MAPEYAERTIRVERPAVAEERVVPVYDRYGNITRYEIVREIVEDARIEYRAERVLVREGYYKTVTIRVRVPHVRRRVVRETVHVGHGDAGLHLGFSYRKHKEHKHRARRVVRRALLGSDWH